MVSKRLISALFIVVIAFILLAVSWPVVGRDIIYAATKPPVISDTAILDRRVAETLNLMFESHDTEFVACLEGYVKRSGDVVISGITSTKIVETDENSVVFVPCSGSTIGSIHNHRSGSCSLSKGDAFSFGGQEKEPVAGIICGVNKYAFYTRDDVSSSLNVRIVNT